MSADAPQLRGDLSIVEQVFRGEQGFIVKDRVSHAYYRFRPLEVRVMRLFDGVRSVEQVATALADEGVRLSTAAVESFARKLSSLGLLEQSLRERATQQLERLRSERRRQRSLFRGELFRLRWSFGDPDAALTRLYPSVRWCFTPAFVAVSLALFVVYFGIIAFFRDEFSRDVALHFSPGTMTGSTIAILFVTFALLTAIHEYGHALACKHFGGEVHEMGFMLLYFLPAFYANVNDAWSFTERRRRLWVTAAGGWIELVLTALLAIVWLVAAPGTMLSQVAVAAMVVGGVGNILSNANPLIPLDGYFALGDWLEIPNLRQRSKEYVAGWAQRVVLRIEAPEPALDPRERRIFLAYGIAAAVYGTTLLVLLANVLVRGVYHALGGLAALLLTAMIAYAARRRIAALGRAVASVGRAARGRRPRLVATGAAVLVVLLAVIPCDLTTAGTFVVAPATTYPVTAPGAGAVAAVFVRTGDHVAPGAPLLRITSFALDREALARARESDVLASGVRKATARGAAGEGDLLTVRALRANARIDEVSARVRAQRVRARAGGTVTTPYVERLVGRTVTFGDTLLIVSDLSHVEAIVRLRGIGAAESRVGQSVRLLSYAEVGRPATGTIASMAPAADAAGSVEARVTLGTGVLRSGATGEARVVLRRSTLLGALWWAVRSRLRVDLLL